MLFKNNKAVIGMIHLIPTIGYEGFVSEENILKRALEDLAVLEKGGIDGIIIENNYDLPHKIKIDKETLALIGRIVGEIRKKTKLPLGINILWNDYESSLSLAKVYNCEFVRVPVFVDDVLTSFGEIKSEPEKIIRFRKKINAEDILLLTDIQVKHAELLDKRPIAESAFEAIKKGADGLIVTGKWTGESPDIEDLKAVRGVSKNIPVIIGSGADATNIRTLLEFADAVIVSTSFKEGKKKSKDEERNRKPYTARLDLKRIKEFMEKVRLLRSEKSF